MTGNNRNRPQAFKMMIMESPLRKSLEMNRSLEIDLIFFPLLFLTVSVHNSFTFSNTKLQCLSNALTFAISLWLLRHDMTIGVWLFTAVCINDIGPWANSNSSNFCSSSSVNSDLGRSMNSLENRKLVLVDGGFELGCLFCCTYLMLLLLLLLFELLLL